MEMVDSSINHANMQSLASEHRKLWYRRNEQFKKWYKLLILDDADIKQADMECVISNDPKTFFKKALKILTSGITYSIPTEGLIGPERLDTAVIIKFLEYQWEKKERTYRRVSRLGWLKEFVGFLLATGWYDILTYADELDGAVAEVRNPAECYPKFSGEGLLSHFHIYQLAYDEAQLKCHRNGWEMPDINKKRSGMVTLYDYWANHEGIVTNTVMIDSFIVKPTTIMDSFAEIPIISGATSGMPDRGSIMPYDLEWSSRIGESIVADNADLYTNYNRLLSFAQQLIRDVAQPKILEMAESDTRIVNPDTMYKRGAIFRMGINEMVKPMETPPLPVELTTHGRDVEGMLQRGSFPWTMYGSYAASLTAYAMSQVTAAAQEILGDYAESIKFVLEEINNTWIRQMRDGRLMIDDFMISETYPDFLLVKADVAVNIPGDFLQRATLSRMLSPDFRFSSRTTMNLLWNEIKDPDREMAAARADQALQHPIAISINLISAWKQHANTLREAGDGDTSQLFEKAAAMLEQQLGPMLQGQQAAPSRIASPEIPAELR